MTQVQVATPAHSTGFEDRVVVVTGGAAGIGQAVVQLMVELGAVVASLDMTAQGVPPGAAALIADVTDQQAVDQAVQTFAEVHGRIDVLVNNAGVSFVGTIEDGSDGDWLRIMDINVLGQMRSTRAALPYLRKSKSAAIVNMSSCTAVNGLPQRALYSASKGAVQSMTRAMAADLIAENIRVNGVSPATVDTPFMAELAARAPDPAAKRREFGLRQPTGRMVAPIEVARTVAYLAHPESFSCVGMIVDIDGGMGPLRMPVNH